MLLIIKSYLTLILSMQSYSGYMAPEYVMQGKFSVKLDVFSFGVLVLEIITGQHNQSFGNSDGVYLLSYVSTLFIV